MTATLRKWRAIFSIYFQDGIAYRASGVIWVMTDVTVAVTMPLVWIRSHALGTSGYGAGDFVLYYLCLLLIQSFVTSHILWEVAMEIKEGQFSSALLRPVSFFQTLFFRNLAWRVIRPVLFLPFFALFLYAYRSYLGDVHVFITPQFLLSVVLGHLLSFWVAAGMSMIALFTQEAMAIFELYYIPMLFLSGQLFPISLLPAWAQKLAVFFPFHSMTGAPTEILIGRIQGDAVYSVLAQQVGWICFAAFLAHLGWRKGLKHYTGVGM